MSRKLIVEIIGDDKSVQRAFNRSTQSANKFGVAIANVERKAGAAQGILTGRGLGGGATAFAGGAAAAGALRFLNQSADAASALEEQVNKSRVVLGEASKTVEDFGKTTAEAFGISNRAAVEAASSFAGLFTTIGVGQGKAADLGVELTGLAGDLASFFDTSTDEALGALRSGLVGEAEPLRRFNVLLSEARVQQEAFAATGKRSASELTNQEKAFARIAIILKDSADAQGDAARTADSLANKQRKLNAQLEDSRARIGKLVVPIKTQLIGALSDATRAVDGLVTGLEFLSKVKIPPIKIPIVTDFGGGSLDDLFGGDAKKIFGPRSIDDLKDIGKFIGEQAQDGLNTAIKKINKELLRGNILQIPTLGGDIDKSTAPTKKTGEAAVKSAKGFLELVAAINKVLAATNAATGPHVAHAAALERLENASTAAALAVDQVGLSLTRASATPTLRDDIAAYQQIAAALSAQEKAIRAQIALTKDDASLKQDLVSVQSQQIANENDLTAAVKTRAQNQKDATRQAIKDATELAAKQRDAEKAARQAAQFRALGLQATGEDLVPTAKTLRDRLGNITDAVKGTFLDTNKTKSLLQRIRKVLAGEFGKISQDSRATIKEMLDDINDQLKDTAEGPLTKTSGLNTKKILAGLGLDPDAANELRSRLSSFNTEGRALASNVVPTAAGGGTIQVDSTIILDGAAVGLAVTRHQQKTRRRNPLQKRGPNRIGGV